MIEGLIPKSDFLIVPSWIFRILHLATFSIHLILMNLMLGFSLLCTYHLLRNRELPFRGKPLTVMIAFTINSAVPVLLFLQVLYGNLFYTSSIIMGRFWLSLIPVLIVAYYLTYKLDVKKHRGMLIISSIVSSAGLLWIAFILVNNVTLFSTPEKFRAYFQHSGGTYLNLGDPVLFPRFFHFLLASIAVTGLGISLWYFWKARRLSQIYQMEIAAGMRQYFYATIFQTFSGLIFLFTQPRELFSQFMGGDLYLTLLLICGVVFLLINLHFAFRHQVMPTAISFLPLFLGMVLMRSRLRDLMLKGYHDIGALTLKGDYSSFWVFLFALLIGIGVLISLLRLGLSTYVERSGEYKPPDSERVSGAG